MATKLGLYNEALTMIGERTLSSLTEAREARYLLDTAYDNGAVDACLEEGQWFFAMRTIQIDYDPGIEPSFGYQRAFVKPSDWVVTAGLCTDEFFRAPLTRYSDEAGYWYAEEDTLYVRYVSNDSSYGGNMAAWPESFSDLVAAYLATKIAYKIGGAEVETRAFAKRQQHLLNAKNRAAMAQPTSFPAQGSWVSSRLRSPSQRDRGNRGSLIG